MNLKSTDQKIDKINENSVDTYQWIEKIGPKIKKLFQKFDRFNFWL